MSSSLLSLGETVHCSVKHKWQLASEASIQVAGLPDIAQATSNSQGFESLNNRDTWMRRGHGLKLSIQILLDGEKVARAPGAAELVERLGVALRDGELWSQLGLVPTLSLPVISGSTHLDQDEDIVLSLAHISPSATAPGPSKGRKCRLVDVRAAHPPDGVPTVALERVNMILDISRQCRALNMKALHRPEKNSLYSHLATNEHSADLHHGDHIQPMGSHETSSSNDMGMDRWSLSQQPCNDDDDDDDEMLENFSSGMSDRSILSHVEKDATSTFHSRDSEMGLAAGNNVGLESHYTLADIDLYQLLELTDAALRTFISADPVRTSPGIRLIAESPGPKLAQISPALFNPGYLTAVSQRTSFVSTIAYTMSSLPRRVLSSDLRRKLGKLASLSPSPLIAANDNSEQGTLTNDQIGKVIKARIWTMMQKTLYNPRAARQLKPIEANGDAIQSRNPDEMLDDSAMPSPQADFDSPLDNGELYGSIRTEGYSSHGYTEILENDDIDFDVVISGGGSESFERGDEDILQHEVEYLRQKDQGTSFNPRDTLTPNYNTQQPLIPRRVYANSDLTNTLPDSQAVNHTTINDGEAIHSCADMVSLTDRHKTHSSFRHSPPSGASSSTPPENPTFTYNSVFKTQRSDDDEDILFHSDSMIEMEEIHFSLSHTPSLPHDNVPFPHEHLTKIDSSDDNEDLLFPQELHFYTAEDGREVEEHDSDNGDEDDMIDI